MSGRATNARHEPIAKFDSGMFATVGGIVSRGWRQTRTQAACDALCGECLDWFDPAECRNYIRHAGYITQEGN